MRPILFGILAMAVIVVASNILVQHPLGNWLTWGALTYPFSFLVTDLVNRLYGVSAARRVVLAGFVTGLVCSAIGTQIVGVDGPLVTLRIAIGSGLAFLVGQLLDVTLFDRMRRRAWWKAPLISTLLGSTLDTVIFFSVAFAASLSFLEPANDVSWAAGIGPVLGIGPLAPYWVSIATADWIVKILLAIVALLPFRLALLRLVARPA